MTTMVAEIYDALLAAGSPEDKARKAAEAIAGFDAYEPRFTGVETNIGQLQRDVGDLKRDMSEVKERLSRVERDVFVMKWMLGFVLAFQIAIFIKLFLH